jgi:outer membrane protein assembly factor BamE (lipoprotein component of BamABCDE complex)
VLPGTSTPRAMQGDGTSSGMTETSQTSSLACSARGLPARQRRLPARWRRLRAVAAIALMCAALGGCLTGEQFQKGYILPPGALEQIPIGASQDQVLIVMGTPSTVATLNGEVFYYISQRSERPVAFMNQKVVDQRVIAIYFDKNRQVQRLANYGLQDGRIFDFISRTTPTSGQELSYLTPLFKLMSFN